MLIIDVQDFPQLTRLRCSGRLVRGDGADVLLRTALSQPKRHLQIELSGVGAIDACGLGVLAQLQRWAESGDRRIQLLNPTPRVRAVVETMGLTSVLDIGQSDEAA